MAILSGTPFDDILNGTAGRDVIIGLAGNDVLNGLDGDDSLFGLDGNDNLFGGAGNDELTGGLGNDRLDGGGGIDTADYSDDDLPFPSATSGVTVNLTLAGAQNTGGAGIDTLVSIEHLSGTRFNDSLTGNAVNNNLWGQNGNDTLSGGAGDDQLYGGEGNDVLDGGIGDDLFYGEEGIDTVSYSTATASVTVNLQFGSQNTGGAGHDTLVSIENLTGTNFNDSLIGDSANNVLSGLDGDDYLSGGAGNDTLNGGVGFDTMDGGAGHDTYMVDSPLDVVIDRGSTSDIDTVQSSISHRLNGTIERLILTGTAAITGSGNEQNNVLTGNGANNVLFGELGDDQLNGGAGNDSLVGGSGNDLLNGGTGADNMHGGDGNDTYIVDHVSDVAAETFAEDGVDTVQASVTHTLNNAIEHLTLTGSSAINGTGNALNNILTGNSANNVLSGLDGNDRLTGGAGNDTLNGGNGNDVLTGGSGRDQLNGGAGNDRFDYNAVSESPTSTGRDVITGFAGAGTALGDQIDLRDIDANVLVSGNQAFTWTGATPGGAGTLWYSGGVLYGNVDGDATPEFQIQLVGTPALSVGGSGTDILL
jgi:Ca2+-binding RTX toxin-like protein